MMTDAIVAPSRFRLVRFVAAVRLAAAGLAAMLALGLASLPAQADSTAKVEAFVQSNVQKGLTILNNHQISDTARKNQFRDFLIGLSDLHRTATFTLGAARRTASPAEIDAFVEAFRDYAVAVYESRLSAYSGQTLKVTGATERAPGDFIVTSILSDPNNSSSDKPIEVDFRLVPSNGSYKVIDASVVGVWLAIEERDQFSSFLGQHNNSVPALSKYLLDLAANLQSGKAAPPKAK
ncbi:MAG: ABC transporter substrate-binding protein [Pseudomonadota bacterium]|nr:ABC transporter substrate-binding protein [Pseudomonadota bacterium]